MPTEWLQASHIQFVHIEQFALLLPSITIKSDFSCKVERQPSTHCGKKLLPLQRQFSVKWKLN